SASAAPASLKPCWMRSRIDSTFSGATFAAVVFVVVVFARALAVFFVVFLAVVFLAAMSVSFTVTSGLGSRGAGCARGLFSRGDMPGDEFGDFRQDLLRKVVAHAFDNFHPRILDRCGDVEPAGKRRERVERAVNDEARRRDRGGVAAQVAGGDNRR